MDISGPYLISFHLYRVYICVSNYVSKNVYNRVSHGVSNNVVPPGCSYRAIQPANQVVLLTSNDPAGPDALPRALADRLDGSEHLRRRTLELYDCYLHHMDIYYIYIYLWIYVYIYIMDKYI